ncbi:hypothetical protein SKAU_G00028530 [Synaphobranchus kaupii]|uniref:Uncharacterized protein n=1 Tax=Synaphobranchus kaupii TaxID=118154 RepID=A0A9Q1GEI2_SYNKA|nr:hypothetical protein SKAU_G00028530 [Synaphobranchus kaupii]
MTTRANGKQSNEPDEQMRLIKESLMPTVPLLSLPRYTVLPCRVASLSLAPLPSRKPPVSHARSSRPPLD